MEIDDFSLGAPVNRKFLLFSLLWLSLFAWFVHQKTTSPSFSKRFAIHEPEPLAAPVLRQPSTDESSSAQTPLKEK
jgi:hypothetical protein